MKILKLILCCILSGIVSAVGQEKKLEITQIEHEALGFKLPTSILLRADLARLEHPEFLKHMKELRLGVAFEDVKADLSSWVNVYQAWDGVVFLIDHYQMALWLRDNNQWQCLVAGIHINKTMGGMPPRLPVHYLGHGLFAITQTVPGDVAEKSEKGFPQALAVTFLIDSKDGKAKERTESFVYDHNPTVKVPEKWVKQYKILSLP